MRGKESQASPSNQRVQLFMVDHAKRVEESLCLSLQKLIGSEMEMRWQMVAATLGGTKSETIAM